MVVDNTALVPRRGRLEEAGTGPPLSVEKRRTEFSQSPDLLRLATISPTPASRAEMVAGLLTELSTSMSRTVPRRCYASNLRQKRFWCIEANYPYAMKNQRGARNSRGYFCDELVLYGIRLLA